VSEFVIKAEKANPSQCVLAPCVYIRIPASLHMPHVALWFYSPSPDNSGWINRIVSYMDPPFCHCELQFVDGVACSVYMGTCVFLKKRTFDKKFYQSIVIPCTHAQHNCMRIMAQNIVTRNTRFSTINMSGAVMWGSNLGTENTTFCSKLCADLLLEAKLLPAEVDSTKITPSCLHRLLYVHAPKGCTALDFRPNSTSLII